RFDSNSEFVGLIEKKGLNLNGVEHSYVLNVVNIDEDADGTIDYVWIALEMDGNIVLEFKDASENKLIDTGGLMIIKHNTRTAWIKGITAGADCDEVVIGAEEPVDPVDPSSSEPATSEPASQPTSEPASQPTSEPASEPATPSTSAPVSSEPAPQQPEKKGGCGSAVGLPIIALAGVAFAGLALIARKQND
ncbi:MAG: hypothetical protein J6038_01480, partial [Bacilli bacterium]|nr:hypothetical protein [Bacilli bacterium]